MPLKLARGDSRAPRLPSRRRYYGNMRMRLPRQTVGMQTREEVTIGSQRRSRELCKFFAGVDVAYDSLHQRRLGVITERPRRRADGNFVTTVRPSTVRAGGGGPHRLP